MSHLSYEQRYSIEVLLKSGKFQNEIAQIISVHKSVVCREIKRNCDARDGSYRASLAQNKYEKRLFDKPKLLKLDAELQSTIRPYLDDDFSPEQVSGVLKKEGKPYVSHETIYKWIWTDKKANGTLHTHLRRKGRRYRKRGSSKDSRGKIIGRIGIENRPKEAENRDFFGHFEIDTIVGKNHKGAILTLNERASGMLWMRKLETHEAGDVKTKLCEILDEIHPYLKSITADNGKEFSEHQYIADNYCDFYFANPYSPWERGSNENLNGLIRQYIPKKSDFSLIDNERIKEIETKLNNRPRKRYAYETPIFVMEKLLFNSEVAFVA